jgi:PPM family protein phosphatase
MLLTKNKTHHITLFAETHIGKERETNEDSVASLLINSQSFNKELNCGILVVADGMGGHKMGEIASDIASKKFIEETVQNILLVSKKDRKIDFSEIIVKSIDAANKEVWNLSKGIGDSAGTTIVGAIIVNNHIFIANVGDSRAYLVTPHKSINQITKDHSAVQEMLDAKIITKDQAKNHPRKNILTKALGLEKDVTPDVFEVDMKDKTLLLCSDGLYNMVDELDIAKIINGNIYDSAEDLISLANKHGGLDNISVALAHSE